MSLGAGLGRLADRVFRIGHLGDFGDLELIGTLGGVEMGLAPGGGAAPAGRGAGGDGGAGRQRLDGRRHPRAKAAASTAHLSGRCRGGGAAGAAVHRRRRSIAGCGPCHRPHRPPRTPADAAAPVAGAARPSHPAPEKEPPMPTAPIEVWTWPTPNGHKVHILLAELGLPYRVVPVNIGAGDQFRPEFLAITPNHRIPAIVDPEGPGGSASPCSRVGQS